jgi:hypothetical protein
MIVCRLRFSPPVLLLCALCSTSVAANTVTKVRTVNPEARRLLQQGLTRSATVRDLTARLEESDLIVYVELRRQMPDDLDGGTQLVTKVAGYRYVRIWLNIQLCERAAGIAMLAHELHHAVEISRTREIVDRASLRVFYSKAGFHTCSGKTIECFETADARRVFGVVMNELRHR